MKIALIIISVLGMIGFIAMIISLCSMRSHEMMMHRDIERMQNDIRTRLIDSL